MKTMIAIPCMDQVPVEFCQSLTTLRKVGECQISFHKGSLIYTARNALLETALKADADWMLWLDSDMVFAPDLLEQMFRTAEKEQTEFVTGVYFRRVEPYTPTLFATLEMDPPSWTNADEIPDKPFEVAGCGFGAVLVSMQVVWDVCNKFGANPFNPLEGMGEDLAFCWRARQCGYKIIADPSLSLGHMGHTMITKAHWKAFEQKRMDNLLGFGKG